MSEQYDDFSDLGAVEVDDFSDLGAVPVDEEVDSSAITKLESAMAGAKQGATLGTADEATGAVGASLDAAQSLLNKLGLASPSPSQVSSQLASEGVTGDVGPQSILDQYRQFRNEERASSMAAQEANPVSYGAGMLAGGIATTPLLPGAMVGNVGKAASVGQKVLAGTKAGALTGAVTGAGMSEEDMTQPDMDALLGLGKDVALGGTTGAVIGAAVPALVEGIKAVPGLVPDKVKTAFELGKKGTKIDDALYTQTKTDLDRKSMEIVDPIMQKVAKDAEVKAQQVAKLDNEIDQINKATMRAEEASIAAQQAQNAKQLDSINRGIVKVAKNVQEKVKEVKGAIGKQYEEIDSLIENTGIFPENREVISVYQEGLAKSNLKDSVVESMTKRYQPYLGKQDMNSFRALKRELSKDMNDSNYEVARLARQAYAQLRNQYMNDLAAGGQQELASKLAETNTRWNAIKQVEDTFLDNVYANSATKETYAAKKTIGAIKNAVEKTPEGMATTEELGALLNTADPKAAKAVMSDMQEAAMQQQAAKTFKPEVLPQGRNVELERLQEMLAQVKAQKPDQIPGIQDISGSSPEVAQKTAQSLIANAGSKTNMTKDLTLDRITDFLKGQVGEEQANKIMSEVPDIGERVRLLQSVGRDAAGDDEIGSLGLTQMLNKNLVKAGNVAGRAAKKMETPANIVSKVVPSASSVGKSAQVGSTALLTEGPRQLIDSSDEDITALSGELKAMGGEGEAYSRILEGVVGKNETSRNAIIFGLMQRPEFRDLLRRMGKDAK